MKKLKFFIGALAIVAVLGLNVKLAMGGYGANTLLAQGTSGGGGTSGGTNSGNNDCCDKVKEVFGWPWWWQCNERRESIFVSKTCKEEKYEYFDTNLSGECTVIGWATYVNGTLKSSYGKTSNLYRKTETTYQRSGTEVNCPPDGNCNNCEEYRIHC